MAISKRLRRPVRRTELVFLSTFTILSLLALCSYGTRLAGRDVGPQGLVARSTSDENIECRLVHNVHTRADQCAFILKNCPDEEAGLISYLQLYYCSLSNIKPLAFAIIVLWSSLLFSTIGVAASDFLCVDLSTMASILGMSESLTGVTFLAFGNGSPDVFSTFAAMKSNSGSLAVGELMGAAGFITAVVAGSMAITKPFTVGRKSFVRDVAFFAVAASFSLVFLRDGKLRLWECIAMVAFYLFYVVFVVVWHWYLQRQRRMKLAEISARLHHHIPTHQELEDPRIEVDEEARPTGERDPLLRAHSGGSIPTLLTPTTPAWMNQDDDDDDESRDRALAELQSNMRVNRLGRSRRNTITPIRPSLLGAIEFQSVLSALEKRSNTSQSIGLARYTDDGVSDLQQRRTSVPSQPHLAITGPDDVRHTVPSGRNRAVSASGAAELNADYNFLDPMRGTPETAIYSPGSRPPNTPNHRRAQTDYPRNDFLTPSYTPNLLLSPSSLSTSSGAPSPRFAYMDEQSQLQSTSREPTRPGLDHGHSHHATAPSSRMIPNIDVPIIHLPDPEHRKSPLHNQFHSPISSPSSSRAPSIRLPPPGMSSDSPTETRILEESEFQKDMRRFSWWPYQYLEAPQAILSTLFPGFSGWHDKGLLGKLAAIGTAPSIFLLTITLPVADPSGDQEFDDLARTQTATPGVVHNLPSDSPILVSPELTAGQHPHSAVLSRHNTDLHKAFDADVQPLTNQKGWNRWLIIVQLFTSPLFVVLITWANLDDTHTKKELLLLILGCFIFSLVGLLLLLATTSPDREPKYRFVFCFLGFAVAIAWISTIANEVVGVLKAIGVILNMSDAILGLTIFAVGNSLGDLVADITIARMGFPKMALSACFGGPMLNILLGIGLGGMYMTIQSSHHQHRKHPNRPVVMIPYELDVSTTLMFSGIALLVTLTGLLIFVPLNGWRMDRKIGIGLIGLWILATTGNVVVEVMGLGTEGAISHS